MPRAPINPRMAGAVLAAVLIVVGLSSGFVLNSYERNSVDQAAATPTPTPSAAAGDQATPNPAPPPTPAPTPEPPPAPPPSVDDAASIDVVVNKQRPLNPIDHAPAELVAPANISNPSAEQIRPEAATALDEMNAAAQAEGVQITLVSGYRSFAEQQTLYDSQVANRGQEQADLVSARPGFSEHQTGLAVDLARPDGECTLTACFGETDEGRWLADNAWRFGFLMRYPNDLTPIVGYAYEPWHFRFIGVETAEQMQANQVRTLEEHHGLPAAPDYP